MPAGWITGLRGVDFGMTDVATGARFYTDVWRLTPVAERNGSVYLRGSGAYRQHTRCGPYEPHLHSAHD